MKIQMDMQTMNPMVQIIIKNQIFITVRTDNMRINRTHTNDYNYNDKYFKYPTKENKCECRTGHLEGFLTSSVEFCKHVKFDEDEEKNNNKNAPIVNVEKNLFVCNNATASPNNFECTTPAAFPYPAGLDSGEYIPCTDEICPFIDESDFSAQIFKDVTIIRGLSPEGTPVNLDKFHYMVTEGEIDKNTNDFCSAVGFDHENSFDKLINSTSVFYGICVNYVGDCEGTIYSGEVKTCTIENYISLGEVVPFEPDSNTADTLSTQQTNNQAIQSQPNTLRDRF